MMTERCHKCKHYILEYAPAYRAYIEGCNVKDLKRSDGCRDAYEPKKPASAFIKRR